MLDVLDGAKGVTVNGFETFPVVQLLHIFESSLGASILELLYALLEAVGHQMLGAMFNGRDIESLFNTLHDYSHNQCFSIGILQAWRWIDV